MQRLHARIGLREESADHEEPASTQAPVAGTPNRYTADNDPQRAALGHI
jgi:hypothetical protein